MTNAVIPYQERELTREEQLAHIYAEVASGRSLSAVLRDDEGMPTPRVFWLWHMRHDDIRDNLARAREAGVEAVMEDARMIADTPVESIEIETTIGAKGVSRKQAVREALGHRRLQIDTRLQYARMIAPRKYGAKVDVTSDGQHVNERPSDQLDEVARVTRLAAIFGSIAERIGKESE